MNPIIKQLAEQAGMNIKTNISGVPLVFGTFEGYKTSHITVEELEKFAELIVRNCVEIVETQRVPIYSSRSGEMAAKWAMDTLRECRDRIKEHFGVKP